MEVGLAMAYNDGGSWQFWAWLLVLVVKVSCIDYREALVFGPWEFDWWKVITASEGGTYMVRFILVLYFMLGFRWREGRRQRVVWFLFLKLDPREVRALWFSFSFYFYWIFFLLGKWQVWIYANGFKWCQPRFLYPFHHLTDISSY